MFKMAKEEHSIDMRLGAEIHYEENQTNKRR